MAEEEEETKEDNSDDDDNDAFDDDLEDVLAGLSSMKKWRNSNWFRLNTFIQI